MSCKCRVCGNQFKLDLIIPDDIWEAIKPKDSPVGAGLFCGSCIMKRLEELFEYSLFELRIK